MRRMMRRAAIFIDRSVTIIVRFSEQRSKRYAAHIRASLSRANMFMGSGFLKAEHLPTR
jgi:hypothetical protein